MAKVCVYCQEDCSTKPRLKDAAGRYACKACADAHGHGASRAGTSAGTRTGSHAPTSAARATTTARGGARAGAPATRADNADDGLDLAAVLAEAERAGGGLQAMRLCPACQTSNATTADTCRECGCDLATGKPASGRLHNAARDARKLKGKPSVAKCEECGYSLKGLETPICPECGHVNPCGHVRPDHAVESKKAARAYWIKPVVMIGIGLPIAAGAQVYTVTSAGGSVMKALFVFALTQGIYIVCSFVVYLLLGLLFTGFSQSIRLAALSLVALSVSTSAISAGLSVVIPLPLIPWLITVFCYCGIAADLLDMELKSAFIFGLLCGVATYIGLPLIIIAVASALGM